MASNSDEEIATVQATKTYADIGCKVGQSIHLHIEPINNATHENYGAVGIAAASTQYVSGHAFVPTTGTYTLNISYYFTVLAGASPKNWTLRYGSAPLNDSAAPSTTDDLAFSMSNPAAINRRKTVTKTGISITGGYSAVFYLYPTNAFDQKIVIEACWLTRTA